MQQSLATRGRFPDRSLETITANYQAFMANGGIQKDAMVYHAQVHFRTSISYISSKCIRINDTKTCFTGVPTGTVHDSRHIYEGFSFA